jgi:hypothetical protein
MVSLSPKTQESLFSISPNSHPKFYYILKPHQNLFLPKKPFYIFLFLAFIHLYFPNRIYPYYQLYSFQQISPNSIIPSKIIIKKKYKIINKLKDSSKINIENQKY